MKHISIVVLSFCLLLNHKAVFAQNPGKVGTANLTAWFKPDGLALGNVTAWTTTFPTGAGAITVSDAVAPYPLATNTPTGAVSNYNTTLEFTGNTLAALKALENTSTTLDLLDNSSAGDEGTFFCVYYKPTTSLNNHMLLYNEGAGAADAIQFRNLGGTGRLAIGKGLGTNVNATRNWTEDFVPTIISYTGNRSGLTTMSAYESSLLMTNSSASQSSGATGLYMGVMPGNGNSPYNGYLSEYIFYNRDLTTAELEKVHSYLAIKYGITLDIGASISPQGNYVSSFGTLVWNATNAPLYHNDVIGIARDDSTGLLQKQSHAFNDSYRLYLDVLQPTNIANLGVFNTDTSFVIMGHNTGVSCATAAANAEVPAVPVLFSRIEREWKVSKTNFSQAFSCDFVLDPCATQSNFEYNCMRLLVDDDGDFTNAIVFDETSGLNFSYNAGVVSVSGISNLHIPDNATRYITLGSVNIPTANLGNDTILCAGQNLLLDVTTPAATYLWQDNSTNPTYLVTMPGTYWVEVSNGICTITDTIVVSDLSFVVDLGNDTTICQADSLLLDATIMNGTYLWQNNSTDSAIYASQSGIYWVETTVSGCVERDSINISVNPSPIFNLGNDTILCENDVLTVDATVPGATYLWHDNSINPTFNVTQAGTFWAIATLNNCVFEDSISITYQIINVDLGVDTVLCQGEVITLDASQSGASYLWQDNAISPTYTISQAGTYWVDVTINNCVERDSIIVSYNPLPTPNLGNDTTLCEFESLLLDVTEPNAAYLWHDNSTNASFNITSAGIYWVESTINNCSFRDSISVSYTQLPVVNLGADQVLCEGAGFILDATNAGASYLWQDNSVGPMFQGATAG
ncbi:MAG: hypothetical protein R3279_10170, partial [Putridiphycobacter sp.]|nr:hypothetical protein [Putridiphycobacter sp.]